MVDTIAKAMIMESQVDMADFKLKETKVATRDAEERAQAIEAKAQATEV